MHDPARIQFHLDRLQQMAAKDLSPASSAALSRIARAAARGVRRGRRQAALSQLIARLVLSRSALRPGPAGSPAFSSSP